jgi:hypothetical protein
MKRTTAKPAKKATRKAGKGTTQKRTKRPVQEQPSIQGRPSREAGLTLEERKVLTVLDDTPVTDFVHFVGRYVDLSSEKIRQIATRLEKEGLLEILEDHDILHYFHTKKVTRDMIDHALHELVKYGPKENPYAPRRDSSQDEHAHS